MTSLVMPNLNSMDYLSDVIESWSVRYAPRFIAYRPHLEINIETSNYTLTTAKTSDELESVFKLRYDNFLRQLKGDEEKYDIDEFDHLCDHLIIKSKSTNEVVGTYRILCSKFTDAFYSEVEFNLDNFLAEPGVKIELGRACIDRPHRNGPVLDLLWKGIVKYIEMTGARFLFGCTSVKTIEEKDSYALHQYMVSKGFNDNSYGIHPTANFEMDFTQFIGEEITELKVKVPSLLKSYFAAGAKVHGLPAVDYEFGCIDFLTVLDMTKINPMFVKRYFQ